MISEKLAKIIDAEGRKKNFHIYSAAGEYDENGEFVFVVKLKRAGMDYLDLEKPSIWFRIYAWAIDKLWRATKGLR